MLLYDVTTLYFEAENEDDLRKVGFSKERRVDPQIVVGLLVDRSGFPLEIACYEGNKAETATIIPIVKAFQDRHQITDMVVVGIAEMYDAAVIRPLIGGSRAVLWKRVDVGFIDGIVNGVASLARLMGGVLKLVQSGNIRSYATWIVCGSVFVIVAMGLLMMGGPAGGGR